jgi:hypothetical protein
VLRILSPILILLRLYGITESDYLQMFEAQQGVCAICRQQESRRNASGQEITYLSVDHDHKTGKIRGLLCHGCNTSLGRFNDDPGILQRAIDYLRTQGE